MCRRTSCSRVHVRGIDTRESMNDLPSYLKFITKSFLKWCRNRFVLVCCALVLFMCCRVGAGSSAGSSARAYERSVRLNSTCKIIFFFFSLISASCTATKIIFSIPFFFYDVQKKYFVRNIFLNGCATSFLVTLRSSLTMIISNFFCLSRVRFILLLALSSPTNPLPGGTRTRKRKRWTNILILLRVSIVAASLASASASAAACESSQHGTRAKSRSRVAGMLDYEATIQCSMTNSRSNQRMLVETVRRRNLENCSTHDLDFEIRSTGNKASVVVSADDEIKIIFSRQQLELLLGSDNRLLAWQGMISTWVDESSDMGSAGLVVVTNDHVDAAQPSFERSKINETGPTVGGGPKFSVDQTAFASGQDDLVKNSAGVDVGRHFGFYSTRLSSALVSVAGIRLLVRLLDSILLGLVALVALVLSVVNFCIEIWLGGNFSWLMVRALILLACCSCSCFFAAASGRKKLTLGRFFFVFVVIFFVYLGDVNVLKLNWLLKKFWSAGQSNFLLDF